MDTDRSVPAHADLVIKNGRVIDPRSNTDATMNVAVTGKTIVYVGESDVSSGNVVDAAGLVVAPGFIDLHSHAQTPLGLGLQAPDGVTSAFDLEAGELPVAVHYQAARSEGRPLNFGFSASWALARLHVMAGIELPNHRTDRALIGGLELFQRNQMNPAWRRHASKREVDQIIGLLEAQLADGALGIGVLLGYAPECGREEYFRIAQLAASAGVPVFTHSRYMSNTEPGSSLEGTLEILGVAAGSGAHMHICHINSTSLRRIDEVAEAVARAHAMGNRVSTEAYPYTMSSTGIGAAFLAPEHLDRLGIGPQQITYLPTGRKVTNSDELNYLRANNPGGLCLIEYLDSSQPGDIALLLKSLTLPESIVASDALPIVGPAGNYLSGHGPIPDGSRVHPRSAGTFSRTFGWLVRTLGAMSLSEAVLRTATLPAELLGSFVPSMRRKGRVLEGYDADITVFDPELILDRATPSSIAPSTGIRLVIVNGETVAVDGILTGATPGEGTRAV